MPVKSLGKLKVRLHYFNRALHTLGYVAHTAPGPSLTSVPDEATYPRIANKLANV